MGGKPLFPVVLKDAGFRPAGAAPARYVLAGDGLYLERSTELFTASVPVEGGVPGLLPHGARLTLRLPRLPAALLERAVGFFRAVYERWEGEAILILFYSPPHGERGWRFALDAPPQLLRGRFERGRFRAALQLDYEACEKPGFAWRKLGTFHSHANAGPTHSTIDVHDELYETGLHITAGYVNRPMPEFEAAFVVGRTRFMVPAARVLPRFGASRRPPASWMGRVTVGCERWPDPWWSEPRSEERHDGKRGSAT